MLKTVFIGTGEIAIPSLEALATSQEAEVCALVTGKDQKVGRKQVLTPPVIKAVADRHGIPVLQPARIHDALPELERTGADLVVVMAYGQLLPRAILDLPRIACLNLHGSLLPRHRGASPVQAAIAAGDAESGITLMHMAEELDTGDIVLQHPIPLAPDETGGSLHDKLAALAPAPLLEALPLFATGTAPRIPQDESRATYLGKLTRAHGELDLSCPPEKLERQIRAFAPWPGTTVTLDNGKRLKIHPPTELARDGKLHLNTVQPEGKSPMSATAWRHGNPGTALPAPLTI